ncbi:MAG TPA: hypothetical protein VFZ32_21200 [Micromonosporaceae bacterium]
MLRSFRFANHKSLGDEAELLLTRAYEKSHLAVPAAGIFGANASGTSNLVDALRFMSTRLRKHVPDYDKTTLRFADHSLGIGEAILRARKLHPDGTDVGANPSTGVWRLVERHLEQPS